MVNRNSEQNNEQYWYPRLPDGYESNDQARHGRPVPMPSHNQGGFYPGHGGPSHGMPGFPPGHGGWPSPGMPGFPPGHGGPSHGMPGFPPGHGGWPGFPPGPGHGGNQPGGHQAPQNPPPNWTPEYPSHQLFAVDPGAISRCMYRFTFVWLSRRQGFWFFPVFVGRTSVAGYRWNSRRRRWEYTGLDLNNINSFTCF